MIMIMAMETVEQKSMQGIDNKCYEVIFVTLLYLDNSYLPFSMYSIKYANIRNYYNALLNKY